MKRDNVFDIVKALLIFLVVFGHTSRIGTAEAVITRSINMIYVFHVPLFFFLSGYFVSFEKLGLMRILRRLVVPYLVTGVVYYAANILFGSEAKPFGEWLIGAATVDVGGASWFLLVLIWLNLILWVCWLSRSRPTLCCLMATIMVVLYKAFVHPVNATLLFAGEVCFLVGVCLHGRDIVRPLRKISAVASILFFLLILAKGFRAASFLDLSAVDWMIRVLAMAMLMGMATLIDRNKVLGRALGFVGRSTLVIFLIHSLFNHAFFGILKRVCGFDSSGVVYAFVNTIVVVVVCLALQVALDYGRRIAPWRRTP